MREPAGSDPILIRKASRGQFFGRESILPRVRNPHLGDLDQLAASADLLACDAASWIGAARPQYPSKRPCRQAASKLLSWAKRRHARASAPNSAPASLG